MLDIAACMPDVERRAVFCASHGIDYPNAVEYYAKVSAMERQMEDEDADRWPLAALAAALCACVGAAASASWNAATSVAPLAALAEAVACAVRCLAFAFVLVFTDTV